LEVKVASVNIHKVSDIIARMWLALLVGVVFIGALGPGYLVLKEFRDLTRALYQLVSGKSLGVIWGGGIPIQAWRFSACMGVIGVAGKERCYSRGLADLVIHGKLGVGEEPGPVILGVVNIRAEVVL
jgi:hypothetical protein